MTAVDVVFLLKRIHTISLFLMTLGVSVGFLCGVMYLVQDRRLRRKVIGKLPFPLPTLEWARTACRHSVGVSLVFLGSGILSGIFLLSNLHYLGDPLIFGTLIMFGFLLLFSGVLSAKFDKQEGRRVALLTLFAFLFLVTILLFGLFYGDAHWRKTPPDEPFPSVRWEGQ
jgi:ABC-type uncharacterized transport system permease subunit